MSRIQTILVPVDFSEHSNYALEYAIDLAKSMGAKIHLIHAYGLPTQFVGPYDVTPLPTEFFQQVRDSSAARLEEAKGKVSAEGVPCDSTLADGAPAEAITDAAERVGADMIVIGTRGHTGLKHVLLGSVAERVVRTAACPVLATRRPER